MEQVDSLKKEGNDAMLKGDLEKAIECYSEGIKIDKNNHVLYSNRSAAYLKAGKYSEALADAETTISIKPDWTKGYSRKGSVLAYMERFDEALAAYRQGLKFEPNNPTLLEGISEVEKRVNSNNSNNRPGGGLFDANMFQNMFAKLQNDPRTSKYFSDPDYLQLVKDIQTNPTSIFSKMQDPRIQETLSVLFEMMDLKAPMNSEVPKESTNSTSTSTTSAPKEEPKVEKMDEDLPDDHKMALIEKEAGNKAYKTKDFETAIKHYEKAIEYFGTDITFYNNLAAVYFEMKEYNKCIKLCEQAIEIGRENRADYKLIAKSFARIGNAYKKMEDYKSAKIYYEKSLSEHRTPETKTLLSQVEKIIKDEELKAYVDPVKAEEEKEKGNELFKKGDYATAVKHYTEAIKRNPSEAKYYSNRAACYTKLAAFDLGLKDCEKCVELDPKFIKGWIRKGNILQGLHKSAQAATAFQKALDIDPDNVEALSGYRDCSINNVGDPDQVRERAMSDPEIQSILRDPAMRLILDQMQRDPKALNEHLQNPTFES
uniref:Stress-induced-phosphoprotein 1 n=1 Tax=Cuerna arida TaxID=1464854 RepID=A0A1B6FAU5_9HEMI